MIIGFIKSAAFLRIARPSWKFFKNGEAKEIEGDLELLNGKIDELVHFPEEQDGGKVKMKLREIVPEYDSKAGPEHQA